MNTTTAACFSADNTEDDTASGSRGAATASGDTYDAEQHLATLVLAEFDGQQED